MADDDYIVTSEGGEIDAFPMKATGLTRQQADIRRQIKDLKGACTDLQDDDQAVQCLSETKMFEDTMSDVFRPERNRRKMERVSQEEKLQVL